MCASAIFVEAANRDKVEGAEIRALAARINRLIAAIDRTLTRQVNAILHMPEFKAMEARWLGLRKLVDQASTSHDVIIRILSVDWHTLGRNLERSTDYDQSHFFHLVYDEEFGMPGGLPFGLIIGDYEISGAGVAGDHVDVLRRLSSVAAAAFCPIVMAAAPQLFGYENYNCIAANSDLTPERKDAPERLRWNSLRKTDDTRFIGLIAPGLMIRKAYAQTTSTRQDGFIFTEQKDTPLIVNGAFAFASTVIAAFQINGWFAAIRGVYQDEPGGGRIPGFAKADFQTDAHNLSAQCAIVFRPTPTQEETMIEQGVIPICALYHDQDPVFNANPSLHAPATYDNPQATQNARLAAMLQYVLCTSRFAHYLKVMIRDEIGTITDPSVIEARLMAWLREYCLGNDDAAEELKAQYPLRDAGVRITEVIGRPGTYRCTIHLQPHFQLDDISTSFHLVAEPTSASSHTRLAQRTSA